jgi:hypothetical protein
MLLVATTDLKVRHSFGVGKYAALAEEEEEMSLSLPLGVEPSIEVLSK